MQYSENLDKVNSNLYADPDSPPQRIVLSYYNITKRHLIANNFVYRGVC